MSDSRPSSARRLAPWLLAPAAGVLWATAFGTVEQTVAPWLSLAPLFLLLGVGRSRTAFGLGWLHGTAFWMASIVWIPATLETFGGIAPWLAWLLLFGLALYLGIYTGLVAALAAPLWRRRGAFATARVLATVPALWIAGEVVRGWLFSGFPWNLAGYAWTEVPGALPLASWVGVWGVGYLVILANVGIARAVAVRRLEPAVIGVLVPLLVLPVAGRYAVPSAPAEEQLMLAAAGREVRLIQPEIYNQVEYDPATSRVNYERLLAMTDEACDRPGTLIVWPESAAWPFELERHPFLAADVARVAARGCPVLVNSVHRTGDDGSVYYNSVYLVADPGATGGLGGPDGGLPAGLPAGTARYDKRHLVPFGEYVPLAGVFSFLDSLARSAGDFSPAGEVRLLPWGDDRLGAAICFEVTFPGEVADLSRAGATVLVTVTNDAWYGPTAAPWQHFRAARWRAAENHRPLLRAAITGVSAVIEPDGSVRRLLGVGERGTIATRVAGRHGLTPFARAPWAVPLFAGLLAASAIIARRRRRP